MKEKIKESLGEILLSILSGAKLTVTYIIPSIILALLASSELRDYLNAKPELVGLAPVINIILFTAIDIIKKALPSDNIVSRNF